MQGFAYFTQFPTDIQRQIFEEAYENSGRKATQIALVSRQVQSWIEPLMYQCISLNHNTYIRTARPQLHQFVRTFHDGTKPREFYTKSVTRIFVDDFQNETLAKDFLPLCSNLSSLACWVDRPFGLQRLESILSNYARPSSTLRRFSVYWKSLPFKYQSFHHLLYQSLTHLDIDFQPKIPWEELASLENLSHFHLDCITSCAKQKNLRGTAIQLDSIVHAILPCLPPPLRCFVLLAPSILITQLVVDSLGEADITSQISSKLISGDYDDRIVLGSSGVLRHLPPSPSLLQTQEDSFRYVVTVPHNLKAWTYLPPGETDFWTVADNIILNRRQNLSRSRERPQLS